MKEYFFFHLYFKELLRIYRPIQCVKTLFIFLRHPLTQALVVYEHANIYFPFIVWHCSLIKCITAQSIIIMVWLDRAMTFARILL